LADAPNIKSIIDIIPPTTFSVILNVRSSFINSLATEWKKGDRYIFGCQSRRTFSDSEDALPAFPILQFGKIWKFGHAFFLLALPAPQPTFYAGHREIFLAKQNRRANVTKFPRAGALKLELPDRRFISR